MTLTETFGSIPHIPHALPPLRPAIQAAKDRVESARVSFTDLRRARNAVGDALKPFGEIALLETIPLVSTETGRLRYDHVVVLQTDERHAVRISSPADYSESVLLEMGISQNPCSGAGDAFFETIRSGMPDAQVIANFMPGIGAYVSRHNLWQASRYSFDVISALHLAIDRQFTADEPARAIGYSMGGATIVRMANRCLNTKEKEINLQNIGIINGALMPPETAADKTRKFLENYMATKDKAAVESNLSRARAFMKICRTMEWDILVHGYHLRKGTPLVVTQQVAAHYKFGLINGEFDELYDPDLIASLATDYPNTVSTLLKPGREHPIEEYVDDLVPDLQKVMQVGSSALNGNRSPASCGADM